MAALIGRLGQFDPKSETMDCYEQRLKLYLLANNVVESVANADRRKAILLSEVGEIFFKYYLIYTNSPEKPADKSLEELFKKMKDH